MGRQTIMRDRRKVNFELDTKDFITCYELASRYGFSISEFGREAFIRYAHELEVTGGLPKVDRDIKLSLDAEPTKVVEEIQQADPMPPPKPSLTEIGSILSLSSEDKISLERRKK